LTDAVALRALGNYVDTVQKTLAGGYASEGSHYPTLKTLLESVGGGITAISLPSRIECGAPDFIVTKDSGTVGYVEAKDIGRSLDEAERTEQLGRYRAALNNLILTDYLEFRWYSDGECRLKARIGSVTADGKVRRDKDGTQQVAELLACFLSHRVRGVGTPKTLAMRMARQAHLIRNLIINAFEKEPEGGSLHSQLAAFRDSLIPDLLIDDFADMYAQTIAYGLFAARCMSDNGASFCRLDAALNLPRTNPFLRRLFQYIAGYDLDDRIAWLVDDLAQLLARADMEAILKDFGRRTAKEDPVVHFYETFIKEYDPKIRQMRGVYYTPEPVVSYIVRSIDYVLKTRFDKTLGLADAGVHVLDPAVGTATFLYMVIDEIHRSFLARGQQGLWNDYVADKLLPRIFGFELLMAPYAVAHLKLGLLLSETGYRSEGDRRLGIYLTNTLEEAFRKSEQLAGFNEYIVEEASAAAEIKKVKPIMVVLGNPPYSGYSANQGEWINQLVDDYRQVDGKPLDERKVWLQNDYVKFIRFGQWRIERTGQGILAFITDHSYVDSPTFRGMRQSLMNTFNEIYILDLHGDTKRRESAPDGGKDENVFDIQQGVAISIFVKTPAGTTPAKVYHADLWGLRGEWPDPKPGTKYYALSEVDVSADEWHELNPNSPYYVFGPRDESLLSEYEGVWRVTDVFPLSTTGVQTSRDELALDFSEDRLVARISEMRDLSQPDHAVIDKYNLRETSFWSVAEARNRLAADKSWREHVLSYLYRPFDTRSIFYSPAIVHRTRYGIMRHLRKPNRALCIGRAGQVVGSEQWDVIFCSSQIIDLNIFYRGGGQCFPLYIYPATGEMESDGISRRTNLNPEFVKAVSDKLELTFVEDGRGDPERTFGPEDIFYYAYAVLHSPTYRARYGEFLKIDFPRLPLTSEKELFRSLAAKGAELASLHLMESRVLHSFITRYPVAGSNEVERVTYHENGGRVDMNKTQYFEGVPPDVWEFCIGGYQVAHKWLKDRKGRTLTYDELTHYQKVIVALKETIRLMAEIDELIPGWPLA